MVSCYGFVRAGLRSSRAGLDATKSERIVAHAGLAVAAGADQAAPAIQVGAKKRASAKDELLHGRLHRIKWHVRVLRIARHGAGLGESCAVVWPIPVATRFPYGAADIVEAVGARQELRDRWRGIISLLARRRCL